MTVRIPPVAVMLDPTLIKHMELRHGNDLSMKFVPAPDETEPRLQAPSAWRTYHDKVHDMRPHAYDHVHNEE